MAILLVRIENRDSLALNEFFDYNGKCYAISRSRDCWRADGIDFADFFEASVNTDELTGQPVVFVDDQGDEPAILGWYKTSTIYKRVQQPSLFLEGNIVANAGDVVLLPNSRQDFSIAFQEKTKQYDVVESEDERYVKLKGMIDTYDGENVFLRYPYADAKLIPSAVKSLEACNEACEYYASRILNNSCNSILEIKMLEKYGEKLSEMDSKSADGFYYHAMALCQLGFPKKGIKSIEKALKLEPEASDLIAQKGILLCSMSHDAAAAECFEEAFNKSQDEQYLLLEGQAFIRAGEMDKGYACLKSIEDQSILDEAGIQLKDMEKKWSFAEFGKTIFRGRH